MREFVCLCDEGFAAIVKLTVVKYILPKLRNQWSDEELRTQAERRPTKFYWDVHSRAVRGEISEQELAAARATIEELSRWSSSHQDALSCAASTCRSADRVASRPHPSVIRR